MRDGVHAETPTDRLQNKLRGVGTLMRREGFSLRVRLRMARSLYDALNDPEFAEIRRGITFSAFFGRGELSDSDNTMPILSRVRDSVGTPIGKKKER